MSSSLFEYNSILYMEVSKASMQLTAMLDYAVHFAQIHAPDCVKQFMYYEVLLAEVGASEL